jgi:hypothetical protein
MKARISSGICAAGMLALCTAAFAQQAGQPQTPAQPGARATTEAPITVTGCIQKEADYRAAKDAGRGGVAGSGVGAGNEFILANASMSSMSSSPATAADPATPTGTSGASAGAAYELTGSNEGQVAQYVGKRVEITGVLKPAEVGASGKPTGGATAGAPPSGVDATSKDLQLRELEITSVREATGTCPAK